MRKRYVMFNKYDLIRLLVLCLGITAIYMDIGNSHYKPNEQAIVDYTKGE